MVLQQALKNEFLEILSVLQEAFFANTLITLLIFLFMMAYHICVSHMARGAICGIEMKEIHNFSLANI